MLLPVSEFAALLQKRTAIYFAPDRYEHLASCLRVASRDAGFSDPADYLSTLKADALNRPAWQKLVHQLAIGETYFYRNITFLRGQILPRLISKRRADGSYRLRVWSAGCATGEEAYTIAMLLRELLPDISRWQISIMGTDINLNALDYAERGWYSTWSMRGAVPAYAKRDGEYWQISDDIRRMVEFRFLNLGDATVLPPVDLVLCRNVMLYMAPQDRMSLVARLKAALPADGELITDDTEPLIKPIFMDEPPVQVKIQVSDNRDNSFERARHAADRAEWVDAHFWLDRAEEDDRLNVPIHFLRAMIYQGEGRVAEAMSALRRCLYLDHKFATAHFTLGNLHARDGNLDQARQYWTNAVTLLNDKGIPDKTLDGLTAEDMLAMIRAQLDSLERSA